MRLTTNIDSARRTPTPTPHTHFFWHIPAKTIVFLYFLVRSKLFVPLRVHVRVPVCQPICLQLSPTPSSSPSPFPCVSACMHPRVCVRERIRGGLCRRSELPHGGEYVVQHSCEHDCRCAHTSFSQSLLGISGKAISSDPRFEAPCLVLAAAGVPVAAAAAAAAAVVLALLWHCTWS